MLAIVLLSSLINRSILADITSSTARGNTYLSLQLCIKRVREIVVMSIKVFYCYAREDKGLRASLEKHLGNLKRQELITGWSERDIDAGKEWAKEIDRNLNTANIIFLHQYHVQTSL